LQGKGIPFEAQNGNNQYNIEDVLNKRKVPENLQAVVSSEYQAFTKQPHNSRISDRRKTFLKTGAYFQSYCQDSSLKLT
jgi:hypothetical protein